MAELTKPSMFFVFLNCSFMLLIYRVAGMFVGYQEPAL